MKIEADSGTIMRQAPMTAALYLAEGRKAIDAEFGEGYAMKNPGLLGRFIDACTRDFHSAAVLSGAQEIAQNLGEGLSDLAASVREMAEAKASVEEPAQY